MNINDNMEYKLCPQCSEPVRFTAKKCPHCLSWQGRKFSSGNPAMAGVFFMVVMLVSYGFIFRNIFKPAVRFAEHRSEIILLPTEMNYSVENGKGMVSTIGRIQNNSGVTWDHVAIEARYFNKAGKLIDTNSDKNYELTLEPHQETAFRLRFVADKPPGEYATQTVVIHDADDAHRYER